MIYDYRKWTCPGCGAVVEGNHELLVADAIVSHVCWRPRSPAAFWQDTKYARFVMSRPR